VVAAAASSLENHAPEFDAVGNQLTFLLQLAGLPADATMEIRLPPETANLDRHDLLERVFPMDEEALLKIQDSFDLRENPDLPEIYESFWAVVEQSRSGLCRIVVSDQPVGEVAMRGTPGDCVPAGGIGRAGIASLLLTPVYDALEYAAAQGYDAGEPHLLEWLQTCTAIYFLDKHEVPLPQSNSPGDDDGLSLVIDRIVSQGLVNFSEEGPGGEITAEGRRLIGRLLAETETYIDRYDIFKDVLWDDEFGQPLFDTGHGDDLRVETFIDEAVDPVRAVFLLRLYDGSLDDSAGDWKSLVCSYDFYNRILEPVVNRSVTPPDLLDDILDQGFSLIEDARQLEAEREANTRIARRVEGMPESFPP